MSRDIANRSIDRDHIEVGTESTSQAESKFLLSTERFTNLVVTSHANNTSLYDYLEKKATLEEITHFIRWDAEEPHYFDYLKQWCIKVPSYIRPYLTEHIKIEIDEEHSRHFAEMLNFLNGKILSDTRIDKDQTEQLNYTFSPNARDQHDFGFFIGGFFSTELMHAKRARQLYDGLIRTGIGRENLTYFIIHFEADSEHGREIADEMISPVLQRDPTMLKSVQNGIEDRLSRSLRYLNWYYQNQISKSK